MYYPFLALGSTRKAHTIYQSKWITPYSKRRFQIIVVMGLMGERKAIERFCPLTGRQNPSINIYNCNAPLKSITEAQKNPQP